VMMIIIGMNLSAGLFCLFVLVVSVRTEPSKVAASESGPSDTDRAAPRLLQTIKQEAICILVTIPCNSLIVSTDYFSTCRNFTRAAAERIDLGRRSMIAPIVCSQPNSVCRQPIHKRCRYSKLFADTSINGNTRRCTHRLDRAAGKQCQRKTLLQSYVVKLPNSKASNS